MNKNTVNEKKDSKPRKNVLKLKELKESKSLRAAKGAKAQGWPTAGQWCCTPWGNNR